MTTSMIIPQSGFGRVLAVLLVGACLLGAGAARAQALGPVTKDFFGLAISRSDPQQPWPDVPFGSWRLWDAYVTWPHLEPRRGQWDFGTLDRLVAEAAAHEVKPLLVLAHSPAWASARPNERSAYKPGYAAEPARIEDWRDYVRTVGMRYKGRITEYQVWNEPSDKSHFTGSVAQLVELTCEAQRILKGIDPANKLVSAGSAGGGRHIQYLDDFLAGGGARCVDVVAHHFYVPRFGPEAMVPLIREVKQVMTKRGVGGLPLWNTETGWWIANTDGTPDHDMVSKGGWRKLDADVEAGSVIERAFLISRAEGVERFYWYAWTNRYGWSLTDAIGNPKPATKYWSKVFDLMINQQILDCGQVAAGDFFCNLSSSGGKGARVTWHDADSLSRREGPAPSVTRSNSLPR